MALHRYIRPLRRLLSRLLERRRNRFLQGASGVIHVGANEGQERDLYERYGLRVLWVEAIPDVYAKLSTNLVGFPRQTALSALVADQDGRDFTFHIANNNGASSSIFDLDEHKEIWPHVHYEREIKLKSVTLDSLLANRSKETYRVLVMDTQGSELLVLKGASNLLKDLRYIKTEAANFSAYKDATTVDELVSYLKPFGFALVRKDSFAHHPRGGAYYDLLFERTAFLTEQGSQP